MHLLDIIPSFEQLKGYLKKGIEKTVQYGFMLGSTITRRTFWPWNNSLANNLEWWEGQKQREKVHSIDEICNF
jgi:hypothetical protein